MKHHIQHIIPPRRPVYNKMLLHLQNPLPLLRILLRRHPFQNLLHFRYPPRRNVDGKRAPIENVAEGRRVAVGDEDGHAADMHGLHQPRTGYLVAAGAEAELGGGHEIEVVEVLREVFVDLDVWVFVLPVVEEGLPYASVGAAGEERQDAFRLVPVRRVQGGGQDLDFRQRHVTRRNETFRNVGVA